MNHITTTPPPVYYPPPYTPPMGIRSRRRSIHTTIVSPDVFLDDIVRSLLYDEKSSPNIENIDNLCLKSCDENSECSICIESNVCVSNGGKLDCNHTFHTFCIKKWYNTGNNSCPLCRSKIYM